MRCLIQNTCSQTDTCCHFCKKNACKNRCNHDYTKCRYFERTLFDMEKNNATDNAKKSKRTNSGNGER